MEKGRPADTFILRIRRDHSTGQPPVERWQVEHVQTGVQVYVHNLEEAVSIIRSALVPRPRRPIR